ncbi:MAG: magnesium-translocating P-type ATPase [Haloarculaceae archaeon]
MPECHTATTGREDGRRPYWSRSAEDVLAQLQTSRTGLTADSASERRSQYGPNRLADEPGASRSRAFLSQFRSPIVLILLFAAGVAFFVGDTTTAAIIAVIVVISSALGFWQEWGATNAVEELLATIQLTARIRRDGDPAPVPFEDVVPGDIVELSAGDMIPGDCRLLDGTDLHVNEASLTGETYPVEKRPERVPEETPLGERSNALFMGTNVVSGTGVAVVVRTGTETEYGSISERLRMRPPETEFERGIRRFGTLLGEVTLLLVIAIFAINVYFARPVLDSFLFALALAVGLTPQLLPVIISVNLARGAQRMADERVIVKRLSSIENFGSMDVLCSDKTGTITEGTVTLEAARAVDGEQSERVLRDASLNAAFESGFENPIDEAIRSSTTVDVDGARKLDEVPYDFTRKRLSVLVADGERTRLVTKGAVDNVLEVCTHVEDGDGTLRPLEDARDQIDGRFETYSDEGYRVLGVAYRPMTHDRVSAADEREMTFAGFLVFEDPLKPAIETTIRDLEGLGISFRVITGDNRHVAAHVARRVGTDDPTLLTGDHLRRMSEEALVSRVRDVDVFAEIEPNQKERIIRAFQKSGAVVGYVGDGINDAPALHAADAGLSVDDAVDVAKEAADIVLLEKNLDVLVRGVQSGRETFANTLKYVFMATSANFGNMFSMAVASLFLPFLPLLPTQILLTNLLTDVPELTISTDSVDGELVDRPRRWDISFIRRFMVTFGAVSSVFDFLTFGVLLFVLRAAPAEFRTGWFVESVVSASLVVLVIRTRRPFFRSLPSRYLLAATFAVVLLTPLVPYSPLGRLFEFVALPGEFLLILGGIVALYLLAAEAVKRRFYRGDAPEETDENG